MRMETVKINFKYFWGGFDPEDNFFTNLLRKRFNIIISDNPDFMFYSVYPEKQVKNVSGMGKLIKKISPNFYIFSRKVFSKIIRLLTRKNRLEGDFVKIFFGAEHTKPKMAECDWAFGSNLEQEMGNSRYMRLPTYRVTDFQLENGGKPPIKKSIDFKKIKKEKTKFCNFIYSQDVPARNDFFKNLNQYKRIDAPGRCMNNLAPIGSTDPKKSRDSKYWAGEKLKFINQYKFTIAFENFSAPGWVTEKLTHPMLVNSIPIYVGNEAVKEDFNTKSFINFHDFKDMDEFIEHIKKVDSDDSLYESYLKEPWYKGNKPSKYVDDERLLDRFEEIFQHKR